MPTYIDRENTPYGYYKLRTDTFSNVLTCYTLPQDTSSYTGTVNNGVLKLHPVIVHKEDAKVFYIDISKDRSMRGQKYYSFQSGYIDNISEGDTLWLNGVIGENYPDDSSKTLSVNMMSVYRQSNYSAWRQVFFQEMLEDSTGN